MPKRIIPQTGPPPGDAVFVNDAADAVGLELAAAWRLLRRGLVPHWGAGPDARVRICDMKLAATDHWLYRWRAHRDAPATPRTPRLRRRPAILRPVRAVESPRCLPDAVQPVALKIAPTVGLPPRGGASC